jgi:hypothetical protein
MPGRLVESGFKVQSFQVYWGFGTMGAVWQGIKEKNNESKRSVIAIAAEKSSLFCTFIFIIYMIGGFINSLVFGVLGGV